MLHTHTHTQKGSHETQNSSGTKVVVGGVGGGVGGAGEQMNKEMEIWKYRHPISSVFVTLCVFECTCTCMCVSVCDSIT